MHLLLVLFLAPAASGILYDLFTGQRVAEPRMIDNNTMQLTDRISTYFEVSPWCTVDIPECSPSETRRMDGSCNNFNYPSRGASMTPYHRMLPPAHAINGGPRPSKSGEELPNVRILRTNLIPDGRVHNKRYTQLVTYLLLIMTSDITSLQDTVNYVMFTTTCCAPGGALNPLCIPIEVPNDDIYLRNTNIRCLNLTRALTFQRLGCAPATLPPERINVAMPMLDLSSLYGNNAVTAGRFRQRVGGLLRIDPITSAERGKEFPATGSPVCLLNQPPRETRCHDTGNAALNSLPGISLLGLWQFRNHNQIAKDLAQLNPCWDDEKLYTVARDINIAYYQNIVYYELMPTIMGRDLLLRNRVIYEGGGHVDDYDDRLEPRVSIEYVIGSRWFHNVQEGRLQLYNNNGFLIDEIPMMDFILRTGGLTTNRTLEGITQGSFRQPCADHDFLMDPEVGERILGPLQTASDVAASDMYKGRDTGLPSYNRYREYCGLPVAKSFNDLYQWMGKDVGICKIQQVDVMARTYEDVDDIDLMAAMLAEKPMPGQMIGPSLACVMIDQLRRWRKADRFWYENSIHPGAFTPDQLYEIRKMTMARLICDHGDSVDSVQPYAFLLPSYGNEIMSCSQIMSPNMEPWRDHRCKNNSKNMATNNDNQSYFNISNLTYFNLSNFTDFSMPFNSFNYLNPFQ